MTQARFDEIRAELARLEQQDLLGLNAAEWFTSVLTAPTPTRDAYRDSLGAEYQEYLSALEGRFAAHGTDMGGWVTY